MSRITNIYYKNKRKLSIKIWSSKFLTIDKIIENTTVVEHSMELYNVARLTNVTTL